MIHQTVNLWGTGKPIPQTTNVGAFCDIGNADIGQHCKIQSHVSIPPGVHIEDNVFIGPGVRFANHKRIQERDGWNMSPTIVESDVSIGMGALIGPGLVIGRGAIIGMGAVVTKNVPPGETWVGNPAHKL